MLETIFATLRSKDSIIVSALVGNYGLKRYGLVDGVLRFHFCLDAIRFPDGTLYKKEVVVRSEGSEEYLSSFIPIEPKSIVQLKIKFTDEFEDIQGQALLEEVVDHQHVDKELENYREFLQKPLIITAPIVGKMTYDRSVNWYSGFKYIFFRKVEINLSPESEESVEDLFPKLKLVLQNLHKLNRIAKRFAANSLLDHKNTAWAENWYERVNPFLFKLRMSLNSVSINDDNTVEFWYNDGELFAGHSIKVVANKDYDFIDCDIVG